MITVYENQHELDRRAWGDGDVAVLQDDYYSVSFTFRFELEDCSLPFRAFIGDPPAVLWWEMQSLTPHWYLKGVDTHDD